MELIERDGFLALLHGRSKIVSAGEGHCMFVSGESGIGKTSLVKAFCKNLPNEYQVFRGTCDALFTPRPLAPLYDILLQLGKALPDNHGDISDRTAFFSSLFHELANQKESSLVIFEDIHWADEATLDFIKFLARRITQLHCLFILTYRDNEIHAHHPLRNVLGQLSPDSFTRIQLLPLSRQAVEKMAEERGYKGEDVYKISGGNPFYVNEILASYSQGVPDNIKDSILSSFNRQEEKTMQVWALLSVIPASFELKYLEKFEPLYATAIERCAEAQILLLKDGHIFFKHELFRRTIESSLSPLKRVSLNKKILELLRESFEENQEIERIVHHAKNANEYEMVVHYAPLAARQAATLGAHIEASKLYLTAIEYYQGHDNDLLVQFYEAYAYECYLINQVKEAIIYQGKALKIWQEKNEKEQAGNSMRFLSRLWWFDGNRVEAEKYARQAIDILESQPSSKAKAMAFSNMSQLKMFSDEITECIEWGTRAIEMAKEIKDDEVLCHALNNVGSAQWRVKSMEESGKKFLTESLEIALRNCFHEQAARAYSNIIFNRIAFKEYEIARQVLQEGIDYCEERDLDASNNYKLYLKAKILLETGEWNEAASIVEKLLEDPDQLGTVKIGALIIQAIIKTRKGAPDALVCLQEAKTLAFNTKEYHRIIPVMISFLEYEWLSAKKIITGEELKECFDLVKKVKNILPNAEFAYWLQKARKLEIALPGLYEPYQLLKEGKITMAAEFWEKTGCLFEQALVLSEGNEEDKKIGLSIFQQLGAEAVYEKMKMEMRAAGIKKIPRGLRESTRTNPAGLTNRELDVLQLLKKGVQNKEIAETLFISPKTVDHHISSILYKLEVKSRTMAVQEAIKLEIIK